MLLKQLERVPAVYEEKEPYTDEELKLIWAKAKEMNRGTRGYAKYPETFVLLLDFMLETNLRVGDAVNLDPSRLTVGISGKLWVYTYEPEKQKIASMKKTMDAYLTDELKTAIEKCEWMSRSRPFKYDPLRPPNDPSYWASEVYFRMQAIAKRCGVIDCRPHRMHLPCIACGRRRCRANALRQWWELPKKSVSTPRHRALTPFSDSDPDAGVSMKP
jgi:integrase